MFQTYDPPLAGVTTTPRLAGLREQMSRAKVDAFLIPRADEHQGEYVPPASERLAYITGFTGSAGVAAVTAKTAALFVDGRYVVQAPQQVDTGAFNVLQIPQNKLADWLVKELPEGAIVGFDPWLHTVNQIEQLHRTLAPAGITLTPVTRNLVDQVWGKERPAPPKAPVTIQPLELAGQSASDKLAKLQKALKDKGQDAAILTLPDSICWLFNIRGSDVAHNPVVLAFAIVPASGKAELFIDPDKLGTGKAGKVVRAHLRPVAKLREPRELPASLKALKDAGKCLRLDPASAGWWFYAKLGGRMGKTANAAARNIARGQDPCLLPKAIKNDTEIAGCREAHLRDGRAMVRFLAWLDAAAADLKASGLDEISAAQKLEAFRQDTGALQEISFDSISGAGPHGAIVHYRVTLDTNRKLKSGELYLIDSGAQYRDGTTDITRTVAIGKPTALMRKCFTLVLKGHIAIATARFPKGTRGIDLDPFARHALWQHGLDFDHGTGHGVGSYLSVHEGPQSISRAGMQALEPSMIISNEPGYYKEGAFGIRIENLVLVTPPATPKGGEREMMSFETITLTPIDRRLIDVDLLSPDELQWLNAYHARVAKSLRPGLDSTERNWLNEATKTIP